MRQIILVLIFLVSTIRLTACQCGPGVPLVRLDIIIKNTEFIFAAKILQETDTISHDRAYFRFEIHQIWKGNFINRTILISGLGGGDCGLPLDLGKEYLIYGDLVDGYIYTNRCSRTIEISKTGDLDYLNYYFSHVPYDTLKLSTSELSYLKQSLFNRSDNSLSTETSLFFLKDNDYFKDGLITKRQLMDINPNALTVEYRYFSTKDLKKIHSNLRDSARNGVLIIYGHPLGHRLFIICGPIVGQNLSNKKLIRKLNRAQPPTRSIK